MNKIEELMEQLRPYCLEYAKEQGVQFNHSNFCTCLNPDHDDHNPSMHYWEQNNLLFCFSCNFVSDIFTLCSLLEGKPDSGPDFIEENVFYLARKYGLEYEHLRKEVTAEEIKKHNLFRVMRNFSDYVTKNKKIEYLQKRNIEEKTANILNIGSVDNYYNLEKYLLEKGATKELLNEVGIDNFKVNENKMIFIIKDNFNRPVSFVSREMNNTPNSPKYINGKETDIYNKSNIFYLWSDIKKKYNPVSPLIIVEGYIDAVTAFQYGFKNIVALGSASFTDEHLEFLEKNKLINKVALSLDNDTTGNKRTNALVERIKGKKLSKTYVIAQSKFKDCKDLDEILNKHLDEKLKYSQIFELIDLFEYELENIKNGEFDESIVFDKFVGIISQAKTPKIRSDQARILAKYLQNYSQKTILDQIDHLIFQKDFGYKEDVKKEFNKAIKIIEKNPDNWEEIIDNVKEDLLEINEKHNIQKKDPYERGLENFENMEFDKTNYDLFNIKFNIPWLDDLDLEQGHQFILASLPGSGKTSFFQQLNINTTIKTTNGVILYISTDDSAEKIYGNFIASLAGLPRDYCNNPYYHPLYGKSKGTREANYMFEKYIKGKEVVKNLIESKRLLVCDVKDSVDNWLKLESLIKNIGSREELKDKYKLLIIDSANKIQVDTNITKDPIGFVSENLKKLSEKYKMLAFINYEVNKSHNNSILTQYNLSGSRRMFYDCNVLGFLYNPKRNLQNIPDYKTRMVWDNDGEMHSILVSIQEKTKSGNNNNNSVPYFYKLNETTSELIPIEPLSKEYEYYHTIWSEEFSKYYIRG